MNHPPSTPRATFPSRLRLTHGREYLAVRGARVTHSSGPITVFALPNRLSHARLGLSVSARVGTAARRNRIKRRLREAFRLNQHDLPPGYDLIVSVRPHEPLPLPQYAELLLKAARTLHRTWTSRLNQPPAQT